MPNATPISNNPFATLVSASVQETGETWRWGHVVGTHPLQVQLDGDTTPLNAHIDSLANLTLGDRVHIHIYNRRAVIIGVAGGAIPDSVPYADSARIMRTELLSISAGKFRIAASTPHPRVYMQGGRIWLAGRAVAGQQPTRYSYSGVYFTLPVWARPKQKLVFSLVFSGAVSVVAIEKNGTGEAYFYTDGDVNNTIVFDGLSWPDPAIA